MAGTIGIKIANGNFYPLVEENVAAKKRLVLTTAHDRQNSVQIELFRSISKTMLDARYIGEIQVDNIQPGPQGAPSIEMIISSDSEGNIAADVYDLDAGGEHRVLNVSLTAMDAPEPGDDFPDFDFEDSRSRVSVSHGKQRAVKERAAAGQPKFPWLVMIIATLFVILAISGLWFFFLGGRETLLSGKTGPFVEKTVPPLPEPVEPVPVEPPPPQQIAEPPVAEPPVPVTQEPVADPPPAPEAPPVAAVPEPEKIEEPPAPPPPPPVITAPTAPPPVRPQTAQRVRPPAPVKSYKVPAVIPRNGVVYQIQWGDTLWDISEAFYRNPWLYPRIARYNNIKNPDKIISGFNIRIPPKN